MIQDVACLYRKWLSLKRNGLNSFGYVIYNVSFLSKVSSGGVLLPINTSEGGVDDYQLKLPGRQPEQY